MEILIVIGLLFLVASKNSAQKKLSTFFPDKSTLESIRNSYESSINQSLENWNISQIDSNIIVSQIYVESHGDVNANGDSGNSFGLMQLQKNAIQEVIEYGMNNNFQLFSNSLDDVMQNIYNSEINIHFGIGYLAYLMNTYSLDINGALQKYNTGSSYLSKILACKQLL